MSYGIALLDLSDDEGLSRRARSSTKKPKRLFTIEEISCSTNFPATFTVSLDPNLSFSNARDGGWIEQIWFDVTDSNFPTGVVKTGATEVILYDFGRVIDTNEVLLVFQKEDLECPDPTHLLAFAKAHKNELANRPIVALVKPWVNKKSGCCFVLSLYRCGSGIGVRIIRFDGTWDSKCVFLAVTKKSPTSCCP